MLCEATTYAYSDTLSTYSYGRLYIHSISAYNGYLTLRTVMHTVTHQLCEAIHSDTPSTYGYVTFHTVIHTAIHSDTPSTYSHM